MFSKSKGWKTAYANNAPCMKKFEPQVIFMTLDWLKINLNSCCEDFDFWLVFDDSGRRCLFLVRVSAH